MAYRLNRKRALWSWLAGIGIILLLVAVADEGVLYALLFPGIAVAAMLSMGRDDTPIIVILPVVSFVYGAIVYLILHLISKQRS